MTAPTATPRPFRLLADVSPAGDAPDFTARVREAERAGYSGVVVPDHLLGELSSTVAMATAAAVTSTLRVSAFVTNNDLRHPVVLGQDLASIDVLSGGRVDVAIGAGWNRPEYDAIGLAFDPVPVRQARLAESVQVLKHVFRGEQFSFAGEHYSITDYAPGPASVQRPHPPFLIGGGGRRTLALAAREADVVGLAPRIGRDGKLDVWSLTLEATREQIDWVRQDAGDRFAAIEFNVYPSGCAPMITNDLHGEVRTVIDRLRTRTGVELTEQGVIDSPHLFIGSVDRLVEKFLQLRDELAVTSVLLGGIGELTPVLERLRDL